MAHPRGTVHAFLVNYWKASPSNDVKQHFYVDTSSLANIFAVLYSVHQAFFLHCLIMSLQVQRVTITVHIDSTWLLHFFLIIFEWLLLSWFLTLGTR